MNRRDLFKLIPVGFIPFLKKKPFRIELDTNYMAPGEEIKGVSFNGICKELKFKGGICIGVRK